MGRAFLPLACTEPQLPKHSFFAGGFVREQSGSKRPGPLEVNLRGPLGMHIKGSNYAPNTQKRRTTTQKTEKDDQNRPIRDLETTHC